MKCEYIDWEKEMRNATASALNDHESDGEEMMIGLDFGTGSTVMDLYVNETPK